MPDKTIGEQARVSTAAIAEETERDALMVLSRAFRGQTDLADPGERMKMTSAATFVSSRTREKATITNREQTRFAMAVTIARDEPRLLEAMEMTMPEHRATKGLRERTPQIGAGDAGSR